MYIAILGRQPALGLAELETVYGRNKVNKVSEIAACVDGESFDIQKLGGTPKAGKIVSELKEKSWQKLSQKIVQYYIDKLSANDSKVTLGISAYGFDVDTREVQKIGIMLKQKLKKQAVSMRLVPNQEIALSSAVSHHNKLGLSPNKIELLIIKTDSSTIIAESIGSQNITAYAKRDQARPMRDAFVGMLPPKLAQIMINLAVGQNMSVQTKAQLSSLHKSDLGIVSSITLEPKSDPTPRLESDVARSSDAKNSTQSDDQNMRTILDPFCGTGVILQEAALMGYSVYGTDLSEKMIRYSRDNLNWLAESHRTSFEWFLHEGDAMETKWRQPISAVVSEAYLGQPFSAPPSPAKLDEVIKNCNHIITEFLKNLAPQIKSGTPICLAVPAWRNNSGNFTHLPLIKTVAKLGYKPHEFMNVSQNDLLYYRENQIVARELLVLTRV